jgi:carbamoyl-phosphate synthase large subunit
MTDGQPHGRMSLDGPTGRAGRGRPANVFVATAGRRTSLVRAFVKATHERGGRVVAGDVDPLAPALYLADEAVRTRRTTDPDYVAGLLDIVTRGAIVLLVPTIDTDLPFLAASLAAFTAAGCLVAVSTSAFIAITRDKRETGRAFGTAGIRVPVSWVPPLPPVAELPERVFVKPRGGSASQDAYLIQRSDLEAIIGLVPNPVVQEVLTGDEITIDALVDLEGRPIHYVPRRRIRTLGGESVQGVTLEHDATFETWIERVLDISAELGARGPLTLQAFLGPDGPVLSEINARFGGGFPLALAAGGAYPTWLLDMADGVAVAPRLREYEPGLYMTRHHREIFTRTPKW